MYTWGGYSGQKHSKHPGAQVGASLAPANRGEDGRAKARPLGRGDHRDHSDHCPFSS